MEILHMDWKRRGTKYYCESAEFILFKAKRVLDYAYEGVDYQMNLKNAFAISILNKSSNHISWMHYEEDGLFFVKESRITFNDNVFNFVRKTSLLDCLKLTVTCNEREIFTLRERTIKEFFKGKPDTICGELYDDFFKDSDFIHILVYCLYNEDFGCGTAG